MEAIPDGRGFQREQRKAGVDSSVRQIHHRQVLRSVAEKGKRIKAVAGVMKGMFFKMEEMRNDPYSRKSERWRVRRQLQELCP